MPRPGVLGGASFRRLTDAATGCPAALAFPVISVGVERGHYPEAGSKWDHQSWPNATSSSPGCSPVLRDAEIAVHNGDAGPRRAIWSQTTRWPCCAWKNAIGQRELNELFDHLADSFSDCTSYEFELLEAEVLGDTAYTVGFEHTSASVNGATRTDTLRDADLPAWGRRVEGGAPARERTARI